MADQAAIDKMIQEGYELLLKNETCKACDKWLEAWEGLKELLDENKLSNVEEIYKIYDWSDFPSNYVQDLEMELGNAGNIKDEYQTKRISYCTELLMYVGEDALMKGNTRRAIADTYYKLGDVGECDRLYSQWLEEDPQWGWGYIGWFFNYDRTFHGRQDETKAAAIIERALDAKDVRDRLDVVDTALRFYEKNNGDTAKIAGLRNEFAVLKAAEPSRFTYHKPIPVTVNKVGRNDPCPCGSGKKYKKCHGKDDIE
jgi:tetratricopeptide (TPR) repeat protein